MEKRVFKPKSWSQYYDDRDLLNEITDESVDLVLDERLRDEIFLNTGTESLIDIP